MSLRGLLPGTDSSDTNSRSREHESVSEHLVVFDGSDVSPVGPAMVEVAFSPPIGELAGPAVDFTVFGTGLIPRRDWTVSSDGRGYVLSGNVVPPATRGLVLVRANASGETSFAMMRQRVGATYHLLSVPASERALGKEFGIAVGSLGASARLLVGNPAGVDVLVTVKKWTPDGPVTVSTSPVGAQCPASIPLQVTDAYVELLSTGNVVAQLAATLAGRTEVTYLLPMS